MEKSVRKRLWEKNENCKMKELSLHILDIAENSLRAGAENITIKLTEVKDTQMLRLEITDDGTGMD